MAIEKKNEDEKQQYNINREATKLSALSLGKIDKYQYLTGAKMLPSYQRQIIEQSKFSYSPLGKVFEKQMNIIKEHRDKQTKTIENQTRAIESQIYKDLNENKSVDENKDIDED